MGSPASVLRPAPMPSKLSKASPSGSIALWQPLQRGFLRWASSFWRVVRAGSPSVSLGSLVSTLGGGGGTAWHSSDSRMNLPRLVGEEVLGWAKMVRKLPWPSTPAAPAGRPAASTRV